MIKTINNNTLETQYYFNPSSQLQDSCMSALQCYNNPLNNHSSALAHTFSEYRDMGHLIRLVNNVGISK